MKTLTPFWSRAAALQTEETFIDIADVKQMAKWKKLIWRGWAVGAINDPEKADEKVREAVWKILDEFPRSY